MRTITRGVRRKKSRPRAKYRPLRLAGNLRFILSLKDPESLFNAEGIEKCLKTGGINLEEMLGPNVYKCLKPAPKPGGWKVDMEMMMRMRRLRKRNLSYRKIADELGLTISTVHKYTNKITIPG
jgi:hypothetical protein